MTGRGAVGAARAVRLSAFAASATVLALGAHVLAGGAPPAVLPTLAAVLLPAGAGLALTRRRRGRIEIAVVLGAVQLALHQIFMAAAPAPATGNAGHAGHAGHLDQAGHAADVGPAGDTWWMPTAHVVAVVITAAVLAHGERLVHLLVEWARSVPRLVAPALSPAPLAPARRSAQPVAAATYELPSRRACAPLRRRGPPVLPRFC